MKGKSDNQSIASINGASRQYSDATILMHEAIARKVGLSGTDHKYLGILIQHGEMTAGELSKLTGLTTGAVTGLIDRFEKKKLVKRQFDKEDRRKVLIVPNIKEAMKLLEGIFGELQLKTLNLLSEFNDAELKVIEKYLISAVELMKETANSLNETNKSRKL